MKKLIIITILVSGCSSNNTLQCDNVQEKIGDCLKSLKELEGTKETDKVRESLKGLCDAYIDKAKICVATAGKK
jgi:hypothetical protein